MKVIIQTPDFKAQKALIDFVKEHIEKLQVFNERIHEGRVCLKLDASDKKENKICDVKLVVPGNDLFASKQSSSFEDAILQTADALKRQLERWKDVHSNNAA
ncbi:MAG TPA: HPF/RaiA family ribosome-associated protein [Ohtaekwangia sp.]|uniref:HPF/RaiA family ribosome-associated protein n=1 Tax=Ohtaekwangia sp. TaxID=2066019 RepID=UPI002F91DB7D